MLPIFQEILYSFLVHLETYQDDTILLLHEKLFLFPLLVPQKILPISRLYNRSSGKIYFFMKLVDFFENSYVDKIDYFEKPQKNNF